MASRARGALAARQAQQGARVRGALSAELGPAVDPIQAAETITRDAKAAAGPAYRAAYAQPAVVTPEIAEIMRTPAFQDALPQAVRNIRNAGRDPQALGFHLGDDGSIVGVRILSTEGFDQVVRAMRDDAVAAARSNPLTGKPVHNSNSVAINARAKDLQGYLASQNPAYATVTRDYADAMAIRDALERGTDVSSLTGPEIAAQLRAMPQHAQEAWATGARTALAGEATATGLRPGANVAQRTRTSLGLSGAGLDAAAGDPAKLQAIEAASGRPGVLSRLDDRLEAEQQAFQTYAAAQRASGQAAGLPGGGDIATALGTARKALLGNWAGAIGDVVLRGNPRGTAAFREDVNERTAALLSAMGPQETRNAMTAVEGRRVSDEARHGALSTYGSRLGRIGALQAAAQDADPVWTSDEEYQTGGYRLP